MQFTAPPDEEWVIVAYESGGVEREQRFPWTVIQVGASPTGAAETGSAELADVLGIDAATEAARRAKKAMFFPQAMQAEAAMAVATADVFPTSPPPDVSAALGVDIKREAARRAQKTQFSPEAMDREQRMEGVAATAAAAPGAPQNVSLLPDVFSFRPVTGPGGRALGYVRIYTFNADPNAFIAEFRRIIKQLPQNGLIIDVRGNGGGVILCGEFMLQLLAPQPVQPERLHFINTPMTLELCQRADQRFDLARWAPSIEQAIETGEIYSQGFSLLPDEAYNNIGREYPGPAVLIIDALCYSTTDIFSAGFKDNNIGKVLGTHRQTGAGGANVWGYDLARQVLPNRLKPLPKGMSLRVALRRTTRVGAMAGVPVEDLGVEPDEIHLMTRLDILDGNADLIAKAATLL
jgi:hypothetical protein